MKRLLRGIGTARGLSLIGLLALSLVIWFEGPLLAFDGKAPLEPPLHRVVLIASLFGIWLLYLSYKALRVRLAGLQLARGVEIGGDTATGDKPAVLRPGTSSSSVENDALALRFQEAMTVLRKAQGGRRYSGRYLYEMPWYMIVGAPGSGKTTALVHSGLSFPLADTLGEGGVRGVGGTRNCEWWFTDEAVLLDTAGRYTTQDSHAESDKAAWEGFLRLLRKHRPRRPINGVIVSISVSDLLDPSPAHRRAQAQAVRGRIQELHQRLRIRFPIYVLVTKADLITGFSEFFADLGREERAQVWGTTFEIADAGKTDALLADFPARFGALEARLHEQVLERVQQERDLTRRAAVYGFPQQFAALGDALHEFLIDSFQSSRYDSEVLLRGVYFTSGTQQGMPADRVTDVLGADRLRPARTAGGRSFFMTRLLRDVMFPEAGLAGGNLRAERRLRYLQIASWVVAAGLVLAIGAALLTSYFRNQAYVADMRERVTQIEDRVAALPVGASDLALLPLLDHARSLPGGYDDRNTSVPWLSGLGLYQGDKLGSEAAGLYQRLLRQQLLPGVLTRLEAALRRGTANSQELLYETLRVYLMLGDRQHADPQAIGAWLDYDTERNPGDSTDVQRSSLSAHRAALIEDISRRGGLRLDTGLIDATRLALARIALDERVYARLKQAVPRDAGLREFSVAAAAGPNATLILKRESGEPLTRGIPGLYTKAGHTQLLARLDLAIADVVRDRWVLGREEAIGSTDAAEQLKTQVLDLYYGDYIRAWDALLADVQLQPFNNLEQGARAVNLLAQVDSPMKLFLAAVAAQTTFAVPAKPASTVDTVVDSVKGAVDAARKRVGDAFDAGAAAPAASVLAARHPVDLHFESLHRAVAASDGPSDPLAARLNEVFVYLNAAATARRQGLPAPPADAVSRLKLDAEGKPPALAAMLVAVADSASALTLGSERDRLNALWTSSVARFCRQAVEGRYPLDARSAEDATPADFGRVFAPGGLIDDFFVRNLSPYVDTSRTVWTWRPFGNVSLGIPPATLMQFQRAAAIRDALFLPGAKTASMRFDLIPVALDAALSDLEVEIDGQRLVYSAGQDRVRPTSFQWPGGQGSGQARIEVSPPTPSPAVHIADGPWAWLRLVSMGQLISSPQRDRFRLVFDFGGRRAELELRASSVVNPFRLDALNQFRCPERL